MPKFKVGDIIKYIPIDNNSVIAKVIELVGGIYTLSVIESTYRMAPPGTTINQDTVTIDECHELYLEPKLAVSDCTCSSRDLFHKGCNCGYAKSIGNQWGLAAQMLKTG